MENKADEPSHQMVTQFMFIDKKIFHSLQELTEKLWEVEKSRFIATTCLVVQPEDSLEHWISLCEELGHTQHAFYHLMVIKQSLFNPF